MPENRKKITKRFVDSVKPNLADQLYWDTDLHRFGLRVTPKGVKSYIVQYRSDGASRRYTLGRHGPLTPELARRKANVALREVDSGGDPAAAKREKLSAPSVADLAEAFLVEGEANHKPTTAYEDRRVFEKVLIPAIGRMKVRNVTQAIVARLHAERQKTPYAANRLRALASSFFKWSERRGYREPGSNPCRGLKPYPERGRERFLTLDEMARLGNELRSAEADGHPAGAINAIRLLLLSAFREMEVLALRWDAINFERATVTLAESKTGRSVRHLGAPALNLLASIDRRGENPYVFPGKIEGSHLTTANRTWRHVRKSAGLEGVRLHDLRHSYASVAVSGGASLPLIGTLLGHRTPAVTARYSHVHDHPARALADRVATEVAAALDAAPVSDASVAPLSLPRGRGAATR